MLLVVLRCRDPVCFLSDERAGQLGLDPSVGLSLMFSNIMRENTTIVMVIRSTNFNNWGVTASYTAAHWRNSAVCS